MNAIKTKILKIKVMKTVTQTMSGTIIVVAPADYTESQIKRNIRELADSDFAFDDWLEDKDTEVDIITTIVGPATKKEVAGTMPIYLPNGC
jgi:hypothetical protein